MHSSRPIVSLGALRIGGGNPVVIQSMTSTDTANTAKTVAQILELVQAGSQMVRFTVDTPAAAEVVPIIVQQVRKKSAVPLIGDFHFCGHTLLTDFPHMAMALDKWRINPGNLGVGNKKDENFLTILRLAKKYHKPIRIGVNAGSLDQQLLSANMEKYRGQSSDDILQKTLVESALLSSDFAMKEGIAADKIILSVKASGLNLMVAAYEELAEKTNLAVHLGLTEAGGGEAGVLSSAMALGILLHKNIGDTIRVSTTPRPGESRTREVVVARQILQSLELAQFTPKIISCPGCGRTSGNDFFAFSARVSEYIDSKKVEYPHLSRLKIAVMGCVVNGIGEAQKADIGIFFPGKNEGKKVVVFLRGERFAEWEMQIFWERFEEVLKKEKDGF